MSLTRFARPAAALSAMSIALLAGAPLAQASNATLEHALKTYEKRLTADIGYLSGFSAPSKGGATAALHRLSAVHNDLAGATRATTAHLASTSAGRTGRTKLLSAFQAAGAATTDAQHSASAAAAGKRSAARSDARAEQQQINAAIPLFETGGRLLHLF